MTTMAEHAMETSCNKVTVGLSVYIFSFTWTILNYIITIH